MHEGFSQLIENEWTNHLERTAQYVPKELLGLNMLEATELAVVGAHFREGKTGQVEIGGGTKGSLLHNTS